MLFLTYSTLISITVFLFLTYSVFLKTVHLYLLPITYNNSDQSVKNYFYFINHSSIFSNLLTFIFLIWTVLFLTAGPSTSLWFNHLLFSTFQYKMTLIITASFLLVSKVIYSNLYFSSKEVYDYIITTIFFMYWVIILFYTNSLFSTMFNIEVISTLIFTLHITSVFTTSYQYKSVDISFSYLFQNSNPYSYTKSLLFFYWISLITSLNLFLFLLLIYLTTFTFDWYLLEYIFNYTMNSSSNYNIIMLGCSWFVLLICIFTKCGIAPLFIWKPSFFKGLSFHNIILYITFFYYFLFFYFINLLMSSLSSLLFYYGFILLLFLLVGSLTLISIIFESVYVKNFLVTSSILNSILVLFTIISFSSNNLNFYF